MAPCGLCTEVQDARSEAGGEPVLVDRSCSLMGDIEVTSVPLKPAKGGRFLVCCPLFKGGTGDFVDQSGHERL